MDSEACQLIMSHAISFLQSLGTNSPRLISSDFRPRPSSIPEIAIDQNGRRCDSYRRIVPTRTPITKAKAKLLITSPPKTNIARAANKVKPDVKRVLLNV